MINQQLILYCDVVTTNYIQPFRPFLYSAQYTCTMRFQFSACIALLYMRLKIVLVDFKEKWLPAACLF